MNLLEMRVRNTLRRMHINVLDRIDNHSSEKIASSRVAERENLINKRDSLSYTEKTKLDKDVETTKAEKEAFEKKMSEVKEKKESVKDSSSKILSSILNESNDSKKKGKKVKAGKNDELKANMGETNIHIKDKDPNIIDLGFGVQIDMDKMCESEPVIPDPVGAPVPNTGIPISDINPALVVNNQYYNPMQGPVPFQASQPMFQNPQFPQKNPNLIRYENEYLDYLQQKAKAEAVAVGKGHHKIDDPKPPKPPVIKSDKDDVNVDLSAIKVETNPQMKKEWPEVVSTPLDPVTEPVKEEIIPIFDNSYLKSKHRYLADIEKIAIDCGVQVNMVERIGLDGNPNGLIDIVSYTNNSTEPNLFKCFVVDTGCIIDKRAKVFLGAAMSGYENMNAYPVLISKADDAKGKSKSKNEINKKLFTDIFTGGIAMLEGVRGMYSNELKELNKCVALISMPTRSMNAEIRKKVRDRLFAAKNAGVFDKANKYDSNSRFVFKSYDKKTGCFTLSNAGVPKFFGTPCASQTVVEINFGIDQTTVNIVS